MSRDYNMLDRISDMNANRMKAVQQAAAEQWPFDGCWDWDESDNVLTARADDQLCGGTSDDEIAQRLAQAIWVANRGFCQVEVQSTYLEDLRIVLLRPERLRSLVRAAGRCHGARRREL